MIELIVQNDSAFVYNVNDWEKLRKEYRIVGDVLGRTTYTPSLPVKLSPEEVYLLVNKGVATLVQYDKTGKPPDSKDQEEQTKFEEKLLQEENLIYRDVRKQELQNTIKQIVKGKRKRGDNRPEEDILEDELQKSSVVNKEHMVWPVFTETCSIMKGNGTHVNLDVILINTTPVKCKTFKNLWEKGYYLTAGQKFGGDFLAYLGDPVTFHAVYIIRCLENADTKLHPSEVIAFGRLGSSVKKKAVYSTLDGEDSISYITINWLDI